MLDEFIRKYCEFVHENRSFVGMRDDRSILYEVLGGNARFISLRKNKQPFSSYTNPKNQKTSIPKSPVYGVLLRGDVFVLDLDCKKGDVEQQLSFFEKFLGFSRQNTFSVTTQSGGLHVYLRCPKEVDPVSIGSGSLRGYAEVLGTSIELDTDLRGPDTNSFIVGPGSSLMPQIEHLHEEYFVPDWASPRLAEVTNVDSVTCLAKRRLLKDQARASARDNASKESIVFNSNSCINYSEISGKDVRVLKDKLRKCEFKEYHRARSFIWRMLMCCYSLKTIAKVCQTLEIDRDSSKPNPMSHFEVMQDLERIHEKFSHDAWGHGVLCLGKSRNKFYFEKDLERFAEKRRERVEKRQVGRSATPRAAKFHRVVSVAKVEKRISHVVKSMESQQVQDALTIVRTHVQPLTNCGADRMVFARSELTKVLEISESRVAQAIRVLSKAQVIVLKNRQKKGFASTFRVSETVIDFDLSKVLLSLVRGHGVSDTVFASFILHEDGEYFEGVNIDATARVNDDYSVDFVGRASSSELDVKAFDVAFRYSRREREARLNQLDQAPAPSDVEDPNTVLDPNEEVNSGKTFSNFSHWDEASVSVALDSGSNSFANFKWVTEIPLTHGDFEEKCILSHFDDFNNDTIASFIGILGRDCFNDAGFLMSDTKVQRYALSHYSQSELGGVMMESHGLGSDFESEDREWSDDESSITSSDVDDWNEYHVTEEDVDQPEDISALEGAEVPEATDEFVSREHLSDVDYQN